MRVLVTGGAGFIGANLVRRLVASGWEILNFDSLTYAGNLQSLEGVADCPNYHFVRASICDAVALRSAIRDFRPTGILHLAAESHVDRSIDGPLQFVETNIVGTYHLLQAALDYWKSLDSLAQAKFRFLHVSTDEVYGSLGETGAFSESTAYDPHSPYSASKASSDHLVKAWHLTYGLPTLTTNCSNNYGPYQFPEKLIPTVILKCLCREPVPVYGTGQNVRDWLYVADHCDALIRVLQHGQIGQSYNIGGNNRLRNLDLVRSICDLVDELSPQYGQPLSGSASCSTTRPTFLASRFDSVSPSSTLITFVPDRPGHDWRYAVDCSKIMNELGWKPQQDHSSGLRFTVQWYLDNSDWWSRILSSENHLPKLGKDDQ